MKAPRFRKLSARPVLKVDLGALKHNFAEMQRLTTRSGKPVIVSACVKADAYGLGADAVGKALYGAGCRSFFVAHAFEGKALRASIGPGASIYVLSGPMERDLPLFYNFKLKPVLNTLEQARLWVRGVKSQDYVPRAALHIDTGMNRLGFTASDLTGLTIDKSLMTSLELDLIMSHLACAPDAANPQNAKQLAAFKAAASRFPPMMMSLANSAGVYLGKDYHFGMVRPGCALYGLKATTRPGAEKTRPVATILAPILQIRNIPKGDGVGYDHHFIASKPMQIATVNLGYADGMPIGPSGKAYGVLHGQHLPVIGRVSMDLTILDVTNYQGNLAVGDDVAFLGAELENHAASTGTLNYEMLTRLGQRFYRDYE